MAALSRHDEYVHGREFSDCYLTLSLAIYNALLDVLGSQPALRAHFYTSRM